MTGSTHLVYWLPLVAVAAFAACGDDGGGAADAASDTTTPPPPPADGGMDGGRDAGPERDAATDDAAVDDAAIGDAATDDAAMDDAAMDDAAMDDAAMDDAASPDLDGSCRGDAGDDAGDGATCPGSLPAMPACPDVEPATHATFTMVSTVPGATVTAMVRARSYLSAALDDLTEQRTVEDMVTSGTPTRLLRIWRASAPGDQAIYTLVPTVPHPMTGVPSTIPMTRVTDGALNGLATFPTYGDEMARCLRQDPVDCLTGSGPLSATATEKTIDGEACRVFFLGPESEMVTVCIPIDCDVRRTLYPLEIDAPSVSTGVTFEGLAPATFDDAAVAEPMPCSDFFGTTFCAVR